MGSVTANGAANPLNNYEACIQEVRNERLVLRHEQDILPDLGKIEISPRQYP
jgi:hypothetical protein